MHKAILAILGILILSAVISVKLNPANIKPTVNLPTTSNSSPQPTNTSQTKTYQSKTLKMSINYSDNYLLQEKFTSIVLTDKNGVIIIDRTGTNFSNLSDYLSDLDGKNKAIILSQKKIGINNYDSQRRMLKLVDNQKDINEYYYIFVDGWVYSLSTSAPELYGDLDQIAQSFKYLP